MSFTIRDSGFLLARIEEQLADNNAGLISAADVRNNVGDAVRSINAIVASGIYHTDIYTFKVHCNL